MLISTAGSGKTTCLLHKLLYLTNNKVLTRENILVFSFSKLTILDIKNKCKKLQNYTLITDDRQSNIQTIDAFCYNILNRLNKDEDQNYTVNTLCVSILDYIKNNKQLIDKKIKASKYKRTKAIFIDEAQDLNETQYNILLYLKELLNCTLHFIGDPNQNIYQFRFAYEKFMMQHKAVQYKLTNNYRCDAQIQKFSHYFEYSQQHEITNNNVDYKDTDNVQISFKTYDQNNEFIINTLQQLKKQGVQNKDIAFLSPVAGEQYDTGIKRIDNLLNSNNIKYNRKYLDSKKNNISSAKGIDLLTIHGSKGLEYDYVFLLKMNDSMIQQENYDKQYFVSQNMNLLYVAITRAKKKLFVIHDYNKSRHICSIMSVIPNSLYKVDSTNLWNDQLDLIENKLLLRKKLVDEKEEFVSHQQVNDHKDILLASKHIIPEFFEMNKKEVMYTNSIMNWRTSVTRFIKSIPQETILEIQKVLSMKKKSEEFCSISDEQQKLYKQLRVNYEALIGCVFEQVFNYQINYYQHKKQIFSKLVFTIKDHFYNTHGEIIINKYFIIDKQEHLTQIMKIHQQARTGLINQSETNQLFRQLESQLINEVSISIDQNAFYQILDFGNISYIQLQIIHQNADNIFNAINNFNTNQSWEFVIEDLVYLTMLTYSITSKHQSYITYDKQLINNIVQFNSLFKALDTIAQQLKDQTVMYQFKLETDQILGYIDFLIKDQDNNYTLLEMKVTDETSFDHILQVLMYDYLLNYCNNIDSDIIIMNALKGVRYQLLIQEDTKQKIHNIFEEILSQQK